MSIKIYNAFRCPINRLNDTIDYCHETMTKIVINHIEDCMQHVKQEAIGNYPEHIKKQSEDVKKLWEKIKRADVVFELCKEAAKSPYKSVWDIECGLNIWVYKKHAYFIPIASPLVINKFEFPSWCEDYHYQNNTDPPKDIPRKSWEWRRKNWEEVCVKNHNKRRLFHEVISAKSDFDLFDLRKEMKNDQFDLWEVMKSVVEI